MMGDFFDAQIDKNVRDGGLAERDSERDMENSWVMWVLYGGFL